MTDPHPPIEPTEQRNPLALAAFGTALLAGLLVLAAGPGTRAEWWHFRTGFSFFRYGAYLGLLAILLGVLGIAFSTRWAGRGRVLAGIALLVALPAVLFPWNLQRSARAYPPIHDITTDPDNPPAFVRLSEIREQDSTSNPTAYQGDSIARLQRAAYPDVQPVMLAMSVDSAFQVAFNTARSMGWDVVEAEPSEGRIEATATTRWFGFRDDVVIRVRPASGIARLDIRSLSRVGRGDAGANAARIREFVRRLPGKAVGE